MLTLLLSWKGGDIICAQPSLSSGLGPCDPHLGIHTLPLCFPPAGPFTGICPYLGSLGTQHMVLASLTCRLAGNLPNLPPTLTPLLGRQKSVLLSHGSHSTGLPPVWWPLCSFAPREPLFESFLVLLSQLPQPEVDPFLLPPTHPQSLNSAW